MSIRSSLTSGLGRFSNPENSLIRKFRAGTNVSGLTNHHCIYIPVFGINGTLNQCPKYEKKFQDLWQTLQSISKKHLVKWITIIYCPPTVKPEEIIGLHSVCLFVRHTRFLDFSWLCFHISWWKLVASFYMKNYRKRWLPSQLTYFFVSYCPWSVTLVK